MSKKKTQKEVLVLEDQEQQIDSDISELNNHLQAVANSEQDESHDAIAITPLSWRKIKLDGDALHVIYTERFEGGIIFETDRKCNALVHDDLRSSLNALAKHLVLMCDSSEAVYIQKALEEGRTLSEIDPETYHSNIKITGVSISGDADQEGIVIIGQKRIGNKVLNLISPFYKWEESEAYAYLQELQEDLHQICEEANQYMFHGKVAAQQLEIDFDNEGGEENAQD